VIDYSDQRISDGTPGSALPRAHPPRRFTAGNIPNPSTSPRLNQLTSKQALPTLAQVELNYFKVVLDIDKGNKTQTAKIMGVDRKTLYRMVDRLASPQPN
jgi:DNA-binding NtrC family response regulator